MTKLSKSDVSLLGVRAFVPMVVVPTFNHGSSLPGVLDGLRTLGIPVIVVDDGSTDQTQERLSEWRRAWPDVRLEIRTHTPNRGKAAALHTGFETAAQLGATHAVTIDSDGQLEPADIPALLDIARLHPSALVLGERPEHMPGCPARCATGRRMTSLAIRAECGVRITDSQCGLRVYPLELIRSVHCRAPRYSFEAEMIARAAWAGFPVIGSPIRCWYFESQKRVSHYRPWIDTLRQAAVHGRLLLRAAVPIPHRRAIEIASACDDAPWWRRLLQWVNPMRCLRDVRTAELGRLELAAALAIGVFVGVSPFFGAHALICIYLAWRLHLHPAPMVLGSQISVPPVGVLLAMASTAIGHFLLTGRGLPVDLAFPEWTAWPMFAWRWLSAWLLGSLILGGGLAVAVFWITLLLGSRRASRSTENPAPSAADQFIQPVQVDSTIAQGLDHRG